MTFKSWAHQRHTLIEAGVAVKFIHPVLYPLVERHQDSLSHSLNFLAVLGVFHNRGVLYPTMYRVSLVAH